MIERSNTNVALEKLFEEVYNMMAEAKRVPFTERIMLDESDLANALDDLKDAIPREIKSANQVLEEQKNIVNKAYADADRIVQEAKAEAERLLNVAQAEADAKVQQEEIVKQANAEAEEVKASTEQYESETKAAADAYAEQVRREADEYSLMVKQDALQYADEMLVFIDQTLQSAVRSLAENRENIGEEMRKVLSGNKSQPAEAVMDETEE